MAATGEDHMLRLAALLWLVTASLHASAQQPARVPEISGPLLAAIKKLSPTASLLQPNELDQGDCEQPKGPPGLVQADFNGDGLEDAAVLIKAYVARDLKGPPGQQYRESTLHFAVLLNDGKGGYRVAKQKKYHDNMPALSYSEAIPPGTVRNIETGKDTLLRNPGVMLVFCGKSAVAYVTKGMSVREIWLSD
jgi:hypothetical protein